MRTYLNNKFLTKQTNIKPKKLILFYLTFYISWRLDLSSKNNFAINLNCLKTWFIRSTQDTTETQWQTFLSSWTLYSIKVLKLGRSGRHLTREDLLRFCYILQLFSYKTWFIVRYGFIMTFMYTMTWLIITRTIPNCLNWLNHISTKWQLIFWNRCSVFEPILWPLYYINLYIVNHAIHSKISYQYMCLTIHMYNKYLDYT